MERLLFPLVAIIVQWFRPRYNFQLQFLQFQLKMLRSRIEADRIVPTPEEKAELLRLGALMDHDVAEVMHVVQPKTYRAWLREKKRGRIWKRAGRPPTAEEIRDLLCRMARENLAWGYKRIVGELKKLGYIIGITTVRDILKESGIHPTPEKARKNPPIPWTTFVHAHMDVLIATDFFTKRIYTLRGVFTAYVLVFIHLGTRKVFCSPATYHPDSEWVMQQARNASMWLEDIGVEPRFLIRDRDRIFPDQFDAFWKEADVRPIKIPPKAPRANAFAECWIGKAKHYCLNYFVCFSRDQLDYIVRTWVRHYHTERPHQGKDIGNHVLDEKFVPMTKGKIRCKRELGGILTSYYREAA